MNTYERVKSFIQTISGVPDNIWFEPGPALPDAPSRMCIITPYGGPGLELEGVLDQVSWQIRVAGRQNDYNDAESIARAIDIGLLNINTSNIDGVHIAGVQRSGGAPTALLKDDAERTHFVCSYIFSTEMALAN